MGYPIVRMYDSEERAREAVSKLRDNGYYEDRVFMVTPAEGGGDPMQAVMAGQAMGDEAAFFAERVRAGRSLVVYDSLPGTGGPAGEIMDSCGPVDTDMAPPAAPDPWGPGAPFSAALYLPVLSGGAAPFSRTFGLPLLTYGQSTFGTLMNPHWTFSKSFGMALLSKAAAPLSSLLNLPALLRNAAPLSSMTGMPQLSRSAAPLSSLLGLKLLTSNPAPLSTACRLPLLAEPR